MSQIPQVPREFLARSVPTHCRLCHQKFYGPSKALGGIIDTSEAPGEVFMRFIGSLLAHLATKHPADWKSITDKSAEFQGWLSLGYYVTNDAQVKDQRNYFRWVTHQATLRATATNLDIKAKAIARDFIAGKVLKTEIALGKPPECEVCGGTGKLEAAISEMNCPDCNGTGRAKEEIPQDAPLQTILRGGAEELIEDLAGSIEQTLMELRELLEEPDLYTERTGIESPGNRVSTPQ